jgi:cobalt transporter subunit CbtB
VSNSTLTQSTARAPGRIAALWPVLVAAALGIGILYVVGFAGAETIHSAAHDTRHSLNFPCH